jgi:hypothetical protein
VVRKTDIREATGRRIKAAELARDVPNEDNLLLAGLLMQGFARVEEYHCLGDPALGNVTDSQGHPCSIVEDFRERDAAWRRDQADGIVKRKLAMSDVERAEHDARLRDYLLNDGRDHYRREVRNRVTFGAGGMTGGSGRSSLILPPSYEGA